MQEQMENVSKAMEILGKNHKEVLEIKSVRDMRMPLMDLYVVWVPLRKESLKQTNKKRAKVIQSEEIRSHYLQI
jgi:hypothetical protein